MSEQQLDPPALSEVVRELEDLYPPDGAESWDAVGTVCGDPSQPVRRVLFAVDPTAEVVDEAIAWSADLVVTHHPLLLRPVHSVAATTFKGALVHRLIRAGIGLHAAHTNADVARSGVADALAGVVGLTDLHPLVSRVDVGPGLDRSGPAENGATGREGMDEGTTGLGRVGRLAEPLTLQAFAERVARLLPASVQGVRVAGDLAATVRTVAVLPGSGDSLFDAVRASGADVYLTSDLRHHPASELRERASFEASHVPGGRATPYLVDVPHFASEWPWLTHAAAALRRSLAGRGTTVETRVSTLCTDPWNARFASSEGPTS